MIICSVTWSHYGYCKAALTAGKAVFTEKPISHKGAELREIVDMAVGNGKAFVVGYQVRRMRFWWISRLRTHDTLCPRDTQSLATHSDAGLCGGPPHVRRMCFGGSPMCT